MIIREHYLEQIRPFYHSDLIKIVTGIRRSGKSVIMQQVAQELKDGGHPVLLLNFEDQAVLDSVVDGKGLISYIENQLVRKKLYVFLDEIQNLDGWAAAVKTLRLRNLSLFITGSNSKLLAKEFTREFSGRFVSFRIRPFVYRELVEYGKELKKDVSVADYLVWGGFPKRVEFDGEENQKHYLAEVENTIVFNDLIGRFNIRKTDLFKRLVTFVLRNNSRIFSVKSIHDYIKRENVSCSINTVIKYLEYLKDAYIIDTVSQYSVKTKQELAFYQKIYNADVAFNSLYCLDRAFDINHNLENVVYNELLYQGYALQVYNDGKHEIDFLAVRNGLRYYIQVAYSVAEEKAYEREFAAFKNVDNTYQKILITNDEIDYSTSAIRHIKLKDFLTSNL